MNKKVCAAVAERPGIRRRLSALLACGATAAVALALCAPVPAGAGEAASGQQDAASSDAPTRTYDSQADQSVFDNPDELAAYVENRTQRDEDAKAIYAPEITTLEDGTQVQPVPDDARHYNVGIIKAQERGCTSCHALEDAIEWCPISHNGLNSYGDDPLSVTTCIACHDGQQGPLFNRPGLELGNVVHNAHLNSDAFSSLNGSCMSCHYVDPTTGEFSLWDEVKYDQMQGFTEVADVQGTFSFDQNVLTDNDEAYYQLSASTNPNGIALHSSSDDSILQDRVITVGGLVDNPLDLKLVDIPEDQLETRVMKWNCSANGVGDAFIANAEVTGIPFETICEMAGVTGDAVTLVCEEGKSTFKVDWLIEKKAILVFQMNGENLPSELGYPCAMLTEGTGASSSRRYITELQFLDSADVTKWKNDVPGTLVPGEDDTYYNKPVAAFLNVQDGQIFTDTNTVTFEGYADGFNEQVTEIQFSLDRGKTWQVCDTSSSTIDRWIYWSYTLEGLEPGSYDLCVRVVTETGRVIPQDVDTVFHIR
ncbi:MAG: molybdopterin-dependent oxidoreductase [Coriobacteriia bacterium]|nr:molybdopterin-dependent oxidoreductase [Coriobacteriia bacterium]